MRTKDYTGWEDLSWYERFNWLDIRTLASLMETPGRREMAITPLFVGIATEAIGSGEHDGLSIIIDQVYKSNYTDIGTMFSEMFPMWSNCEIADTPFLCTDGHNAFEEFFLHVLLHQFKKHNIVHPLATDEPDTIGLIDRHNLLVLWCGLYAMNHFHALDNAEILQLQGDFAGGVLDLCFSTHVTGVEARQVVEQLLWLHVAYTNVFKEKNHVQVQQPCS